MLARLLAAFLFVGVAHGFAEAGKLAPGAFLVASRDLGDPNFARAVILLVRYDEENGALGLIINRQSDVPLSRVFAELKEAKDRSDPIYLGGPVETGSVLALLKSDVSLKDTNRVFGDVYLISSKALLEKTLAAGTEADRFHAYLGYAGWAREQLEHEVELGAWHVMPAEAGSVFHSDPDSVWPRLIRRTEMRIARRVSPNQPVQRVILVVNR